MTQAGFPMGAGGLISPHALRPLQKAVLWAAGGRRATPGPQAAAVAARSPGQKSAVPPPPVCPWRAVPLSRTSRGPGGWLGAQKQWAAHQPAWWEDRTDVRLLFSPRRRPITHWVTDALFSGEVAAGQSPLPTPPPCAPSQRPPHPPPPTPRTARAPST